MRIAHLSIMGLTAATVFVAGTSAITAQPRGRGAGPLYPLLDGDLYAARGSGCELSFETGRNRLVYVVGEEFMIKTSSGRTICEISREQFSSLVRGGIQSCGGYRITIRGTGRTVVNEASDSTTTPAMLTVSGRGRPWTVRGTWGSAC